MPNLQSLRNEDYRDRELLGVIKDVADSEGYATTTDIALRLGFTTNGAKGLTPARKVSTRLSWMRQGGLIERMPPERRSRSNEPGSSDSRWSLSPIGNDLLAGKMTATLSKALDRMGPGSQVLMMRELTQRAYVDGDFPVAFAVRREFQHLQARRQMKRR